MRYLGPAALTAASLVLLMATDGGSADRAPAANAPAVNAPAVAQAVAEAVAPVAAGAATAGHAPGARPAVTRRIVRRVLPDPTIRQAGRQTGRRRDPLPAEVYTGPGFDACNAPTLDALRAWHGTSPYGALGIYTSGNQRYCDQARLNADWVREARAMGWKLIPTHVGLQAPCTTNTHKPDHIDPANAVEQGRDEAAQAVSALKALGLGKGSPVYLDIESYSVGDSVCSQAVIDFTLGWTQALHRAGYHSGFYSSIDSGIADLAAAARAGSSPLPDAVWYARWDDKPTTTDGSGALGSDLWARHERIHQHHGEVLETYGGTTLEIDRDQLDALVAR